MTARATRLAISAAVLAAAAFVLQPVLQRSGDHAPPSSAGGPTTVRALEPVGDIPRAPQVFVWSCDPAASEYRLELVGPNDSVFFTHETADTVARFSRHVDWNILAGASWRVVPYYGSRAGTASEMVSFHIDSP